jgi:hypothetical protein
MTVRVLLVLAAVGFSANALAQDAAPNVGNKLLARVRPKEPMGCKLVGTVRGTKLWAGDCVGSEVRGTTPSADEQPSPEQSLPERASRVILPGQKQ